MHLGIQGFMNVTIVNAELKIVSVKQADREFQADSIDYDPSRDTWVLTNARIVQPTIYIGYTPPLYWRSG